MLPLELFRSSTFSGANLLTFLLYGALGGSLFFLPLDLIQVHHYSTTAAGAALLPFVGDRKGVLGLCDREGEVDDGGARNSAPCIRNLAPDSGQSGPRTTANNRG